MSLLSPFILYSFNPTPSIQVCSAWMTLPQEEEENQVCAITLLSASVFASRHQHTLAIYLPVIGMFLKGRTVMLATAWA